MGAEQRPGRALTPFKPAAHTEVHGKSELTPEEMRRRYPRVKAPGVNASVRARKPHEYRNTLIVAEFKGKCDLDGQGFDARIHRF